MPGSRPRWPPPGAARPRLRDTRRSRPARPIRAPGIAAPCAGARPTSPRSTRRATTSPGGGSYWRETRVQGVIINAGGIVAYYPSKFPLHHRAEALGDRDLYGELARAAHEDGLFVLARMDSNRTHEAFYRAHPDWFAVDRAGQPYRAGELYVTCVNSPYYDEYLPGVLREIIERSHPEGFTDNSWSGLDRESICYCAHCQRRFRDRTRPADPGAEGLGRSAVPRVDPLELRPPAGDLGPEQPHDAPGGRAGLPLGRHEQRLGLGPGDAGSATSRRSAAAPRSSCSTTRRGTTRPASRRTATPASWCTACSAGTSSSPRAWRCTRRAGPTFRLASKPEPEARLWMLDGFAGGIQPWWHHVGAYQEDRRLFRTVEPLIRWHEENEEYLVDRRPVASVGVVWSQRNTDFYGRDDAGVLVDLPYRGMTHALIRARIPYLPVHVDHVDRDGGTLSVLVLPDLAALSDRQCASIRRFVERGGSLVATGRTSLYDEWGNPRPDFALGDLLGVRRSVERKPSIAEDLDRARGTSHTYLRLPPEPRTEGDGPKPGGEPPATGQRHPVLAGFDETDILPFGGVLEGLAAVGGRGGAPDLRPAVPDLPARDGLDAQAPHRHPGTDRPDDARGQPGRLPAGRPRSPLRPRQPARPRRPAGQPRALGRAATPSP